MVTGKAFLVCGGRDYDDRDYVFDTLDRIHEKVGIGLIVHGGARGADSLADQWAKSRCIPHLCFPADWKRFGKKAGGIRNQQMLDNGPPDGVVAFPGGAGTADMVGRAKAAGVKVWELTERSKT